MTAALVLLLQSRRLFVQLQEKSRCDHCRVMCAPPTRARLAALSRHTQLTPHHPEARRSSFLCGSAVRSLSSSRLLQSKALSRSCLSAGHAPCCNSTNEATSTLYHCLSPRITFRHFVADSCNSSSLLFVIKDCSPSIGADTSS